MSDIVEQSEQEGESSSSCESVAVPAKKAKRTYRHRQGRIKVRGGPRLDTVMGPYFFHLLYHRLRTLSFWGYRAPGKF